MVLYMYLSRSLIRWKDVAKLAYKKVLIGAAMLAVVFAIGHVLPRGFGALVIQVAAGGSIYVLGSFLVKDSFALSIWNILKDKLKKAN